MALPIIHGLLAVNNMSLGASGRNLIKGTKRDPVR